MRTRPGVGPQARHRRGRDDRPRRFRLGRGGRHHGVRRVFGGDEDAQDVGLERVHELVARDVDERLVGADGAGVGEHDVQPAVALDRVIDHPAYRRLVRRVELLAVHVDVGIPATQLVLQGRQVLGVPIADVDGPRPVAGELMRAGPADPRHRVGAGDDGDLAADPPAPSSSTGSPHEGDGWHTGLWNRRRPGGSGVSPLPPERWKMERSSGRSAAAASSRAPKPLSTLLRIDSVARRCIRYGSIFPSPPSTVTAEVYAD